MRGTRARAVMVALVVGIGSLGPFWTAGAADAQGHGEHHPMPSAPRADGSPPSPYAAPWLAGAEIRALSPAEVAQIIAGEGAGLARAAELNGLPGPRHVLDLAAELALTASQAAEIQAIFDAMRAEALAAGQLYLTAQQALENDFRANRVSRAALPARVAAVGRLRADLETVHLAAHLATHAELTPLQIEQYQLLRGYSGS
jgi:Spy/CpxP family protein refolding chaperone